MRKRTLYSCVLVAALAVSVMGCSKKETEVKTIEYSEQIGTAEGTVDFESEEEPVIDIKEIRSYKGENIDYSSGISISNADKFEDFQMWVDSTGVDIYTPGKYIAVYRFVYDGKTVEENVSVTILEKEEEQQVSTYSSGNNVASGNTGSTVNDATEATTPQENQGAAAEGNATQGTSQGAAQTATQGTAGNNSSGTTGSQQTATQTQSSQQTATQKPTSQQTATQKTTSKQQTASREIITTKKTSTDKVSTIGYTNIELLSGTYVKIKCTNAKYIVSTRTDTSTTVKNGVSYEVSKLVITYNTGAEQVLETVETAIK